MQVDQNQGGSQDLTCASITYLAHCQATIRHLITFLLFDLDGLKTSKKIYYDQSETISEASL